MFSMHVVRVLFQAGRRLQCMQTIQEALICTSMRAFVVTASLLLAASISTALWVIAWKLPGPFPTRIVRDGQAGKNETQAVPVIPIISALPLDAELSGYVDISSLPDLKRVDVDIKNWPLSDLEVRPDSSATWEMDIKR
jgi:ATP-dependent helicase YprA (DUF1998 family)